MKSKDPLYCLRALQAHQGILTAPSPRECIVRIP
jgi:hypothetical protein